MLRAVPLAVEIGKDLAGDVQVGWFEGVDIVGVLPLFHVLMLGT